MTTPSPLHPASATPAFVVVTLRGLILARRLQAALFPTAQIHGLAGRADGADVSFVDTIGTLQRLFASGAPLIGVCASGILIRILAPLLVNKHQEPPVLAIAEDGSVVVPLLGGHHGGNALARQLAQALGAEAVAAVTTAGDLRRPSLATTMATSPVLDEPPPGWRLANPEHARPVMAAWLAGAPVQIEGDLPWLPERAPAAPYALPPIHLIADSTVRTGNNHTLVYHPTRLALGVGCVRGCPPEALAALVEDTLATQGLAPQAIAGVFSLNLKADEPAVQALAARLGVPARFFPATGLEAETPRLSTPSETVFREVGCHGVAEAAALAAAGPDAVLRVPKRKTALATLAIAEAPAPLDATGIGRPRGRLMIVGIGPGDAAWRTPEVSAWLMAASDVVGYRLYLDLLGAPHPDQTFHSGKMGAEEDRVWQALELAAEGRNVALVSSGDAGIYAMAALVFELLERENRPEWNRLEVVVSPGISALQAAAARAGAPIGHDFCTISLSDLLTPWPAIENRLHAAAAGDFIVALYNPVSHQRVTQLPRARDILLAHRAPDTPVILARNLGRSGETVRVTTLEALTPADADMLTLVIVGSSQTRRLPRSDGGVWVYTPRGYAAKHTTSPEAPETTPAS